MKRGLLILLFILVLQMSPVFAEDVEIQLSKDIYEPKETLQAEIYANFLDPLELENIYFYRDRSIPVIYDILKLSDKYLLYALLLLKFELLL